MLGAIVDFSERRKRGLRLVEVHRLALPVEGKSLLLFLLPGRAEAFESLSERKRNRLLGRLMYLLRKYGAECVFAKPPLAEPLSKKFYIPDGRRIFCAMAGYIIERYCKTFSYTPDLLRVSIYEAPITQNAYRAAEFMAMRTKQLCIVSPDMQGAEALRLTLLEEYGLSATVGQNEKQMRQAHITLLLSAPACEVQGAGLVLDFTTSYPYRARRDFCFEPAFGYASLMPYLQKPDCRAAEFILCAAGEAKTEDIEGALERIGWKRA